jgi:hypothetical protein
MKVRFTAVVVVGCAGLVVPAGVGAAAPPPDLEVTADPSTGLVDGQIIQVTGTGFPEPLMEIFECRADAVDESGCDPDNAYFADLDSDGVVRESFPLDARIFDEAGNEFDCRSAPNACKIGVGFLTDFDQSAFALLDFDPDAPLLPVPTVTVTPDRNLRDQQIVKVRGEGLSSLFETFVYQCIAGEPRSGETCTFDQDVRAVADDRGRIAVDYRVEATLRPTITGEPFDCTAAPGACVIEISQGFSASPDRFARTGLSFRRAAPSPAPTTTAPPTPPAAPPATPIPQRPDFTG